MLKTVKNGSGIRVEHPPPSPVFFLQNSHIFPFFWGGSVPNKCVESFQQCIPSNMVLSEKEEWVLFVLYASETLW